MLNCKGLGVLCAVLDGMAWDDISKITKGSDRISKAVVIEALFYCLCVHSDFILKITENLKHFIF